ncbi:(2Fe-2S)-binding protein [Jiangella asiatica]|uniref:(2Fe-2S)-binding protein n=1 Tax=Jiangella asiatica TaxID=2530372 RepID=A0A4R5CN77_9ACTN|nr:(2Fe-2S)-binding protein [Jiangella asiatica]TDE01476.1 (2Fe-2S)-binding protein [Jiangella asiatica]
MEFEAACRVVPGVPVPESAPGARGVRWVGAGELADRSVLSSLLAAARGASPAGSVIGDTVALAQGLAYTLVGPSAAGAYGAGLVVDLDPDGVWFGFGAQGFCERLALRQVVVLPATDGFERRLAEPAVAILKPVFDQVHQLTRVGQRVLWAAVSDSVHQIMLSAGLPRGTDSGPGLGAALDGAWLGAGAIVDALAERAPELTARPRRFRVVDDDLAASWLVRGGCCFVYREGADYCVTCPIIGDDERRAALLRWMRSIGLGTGR